MTGAQEKWLFCPSDEKQNVYILRIEQQSTTFKPYIPVFNDRWMTIKIKIHVNVEATDYNQCLYVVQLMLTPYKPSIKCVHLYPTCIPKNQKRKETSSLSCIKLISC